MDVKEKIFEISKLARAASREVANISMDRKNEVLVSAAGLLESEKEFILKENEKDLKNGEEKGLSKAMLDRLKLTDSRLKEMQASLKEVASLPDPVGEVTGIRVRPNGLRVGKMRIPLGVICIIYEARPNVTTEAASLCLKSGNAVLLRGGSEAINSNLALADIFQKALEKAGVSRDAVQVIPFIGREGVLELLKLDELIDLIIPRGGESLIRFVAENSRIPVIKHYKGVCHIFVDESADLEMAYKVCLNAKVQRPGVCNAMETLLVHEKIAGRFLPEMGKLYTEKGVDIRGCEKTKKILPYVKDATEDDYYAEFLDLILAVKVVSNIDEAIEHIEKYGSLHTESIITTDYNNSEKFLKEVNSSSVLVNASTRFSDGFQFGLGAEIGISTSKIHSFGPMGLADLTTQKFIVYGSGQVRN